MTRKFNVRKRAHVKALGAWVWPRIQNATVSQTGDIMRQAADRLNVSMPTIRKGLRRYTSLQAGSMAQGAMKTEPLNMRAARPDYMDILAARVLVDLTE